MKQIFCRIERCLACRACVLACAVEHSKSRILAAALAENPPPQSRIRIVCADGQSSTGGGLRAMAILCRHCPEAACVEACVTGAIVRDETTGIVRLNQEECVGCWACIEVCPHGAIVQASDEGVALKCDRCPDRKAPACLEACPVGALVLMEPEEFEALCREAEVCHERKR